MLNASARTIHYQQVARSMHGNAVKVKRLLPPWFVQDSIPAMSTNRTAYDLVVLAGDVGGTNVNLAIVGKKGGSLSILFDRHYKTQDEASFTAPLCRFLAEARQTLPAFPPELCCVSGAGPVDGNSITLTNASWCIDGDEIRKTFGFPTLIINDFMAVSYGVAMLDPNDPQQLIRLPHTNGSLPDPAPGGIKAIIGAGTGLGAGYLVKQHDRLRAFPSEGGHVALPAYDEQTRAFSLWLERKYGFVPGAEAGISGHGIANLFSFMAEMIPTEQTYVSQDILALPEEKRPARIAAAASADALCGRTMQTFVNLYARFASDMTAIFLPTGGLYLAGGIASKNESLFTADHLFMRMYERSYRDHIRTILGKTPVFIVKDYNISLYGAANAAIETLT